MILDRKNGYVYLPTTLADKASLADWAKHEPTLTEVEVEALTPLHESRYRKVYITRPAAERDAMGLRALVHTEVGRRFANRYHLSDFDQALRFLAQYPKAREELLDFSVLEGDGVPAKDFPTWLKNLGFLTSPALVEATPVVYPWEPKTSLVRNHDIYCTYINVDAHEERRAAMDEGLVSLGWISARLSATTPADIHRHTHVEGYADLPRKRQIEYALAVSHLRALEDVVRSGCGWGLVMEDDLDFSSAQNWAFDLSDIPALLPDDCGIFQMQMIWPIAALEGNNVRLVTSESLALRSHIPQQDWGAAAYLVRREYAQEILKRFTVGDRFRLDNYPGNVVPDACLYDHTVFSSVFRAYCSPLMYCREAGSTLGNDTPVQSLMHRASRALAQSLATRAGTIKVADVFRPVTPTDYPFVSIITPTFNRRHLLPLLEECILRQNYPRCRMEWILVDDSQDGQPPFVPRENTGLSVKYTVLAEKLPLGAKRNFTLSRAKGNICVYMDDDDYYPPTRVSVAVEALQAHPEVHVVGTTFMPIFYIEADEYWLAGPWGQNHTTAGSLAHRRILTETQRFDATARWAEEPSFLDGYQLPLIQLNPYQTMTCIAHGTNTYDKRKVLGTNKVKPSETPIFQVIPDTLMVLYKKLHTSKAQ